MQPQSPDEVSAAPQLSEMFFFFCLCLNDSSTLLLPRVHPPINSTLSVSPLIFSDRPDRRRAPERAHADHARHLHQGHSCGQTRKQERVPVSRLQDPPEGAHVRVDLQPEDQRESLQVDFSRSGLASADLTGN